MRRRATVELDAVLTAATAAARHDAEDTRILDATEALLRADGLRGWTVDDVAAAAAVGRSSVYRRFGDRDALVHAVLARELRRTLRAMADAVDGLDDVEGRAVAGVSAALRALEASVVDALLRSDPDTFLPFLTIDAGPLLAIARTAIVAELSRYGDRPSVELAEAAARFGMSFVLTRSTVLPLDDPAALDAAVRRMVRPFVRPAG